MAYPRQRVYLSIQAWWGFFSHLLSQKLLVGLSLQKFEQAFADFIGVKYAVAVPSGRKGLQNALHALNLSPGAEVVIPAFTYPAVPFVVEEMGYTIRFVDVELTSFGIDISALEKLLKTSNNIEAIIPTHLYGVPCNIEAIQTLCKQYKLYMIEDCAHCGETYVNGHKTGSFSDIAYFSFETSKSINTLGGGMLTTSSTVLAERLSALQAQGNKNSSKHLFKRLLKSTFEALVTQAQLFNLFIYPALRAVDLLTKNDDTISKKYIGKDISLKGRTFAYSNYQAWLGLQQLDRLAEITSYRVKNAHYLSKQLQQHTPCHKTISDLHKPNWLLFSIRVKNKELLASKLLKQGVDTKRDYMRDCSELFIKDKDQKSYFKNAQSLDKEVLHLPCYPELKESDLKYISETVIDNL